MKEVKITINGKEYKKTRPTLLDLRRMAEYQKAMQVKKDGKILRKNIAVDEDALNATLKFIVSFVGAEGVTLGDDTDLLEVFEAMRTIDKNIAEALTGTNDEKNAEGR